MSASDVLVPSPRREFPAPPMAASAVVLRAHPLRGSFNDALADAWVEGARARGLDVEVIDVTSLTFDLRLRLAFTGDQPLEPDLERVRDRLAEGAHLVVASPVWWGSVPAQLRGLFDRVLLPGWAFTAGDSGSPSGVWLDGAPG